MQSCKHVYCVLHYIASQFLSTTIISSMVATPFIDTVVYLVGVKFILSKAVEFEMTLLCTGGQPKKLHTYIHTYIHKINVPTLVYIRILVHV